MVGIFEDRAIKNYGKMKYVVLALIILLQFHISYGQTIKDLFLELPLGGLSLNQKKKMIYNYLHQKKDAKSERPYLIDYQPNNYFLSYSGAYEGSETLNCWQMSSGSLLVGIGYLECAGICNHDLRFFVKTDDKLSKLPTNYVLPEVTMADFFDTEQMIKDGIEKSITNRLFNGFYGFMYHLPEEGEDITVESLTHKYGEIPTKYKKYDLGSKMKLVWNDGIFKKRDKSVAIKDKAEAYKIEKSFSIENYVTEFSMSDTLTTKNGYQFMFVDSKLSEGTRLKMSILNVNSELTPNHKHIENRFIYILEGKAEFYLKDQSKIGGPNTSFYCPADIEHSLKNIGNTDLKYLVIEYNQK